MTSKNDNNQQNIATTMATTPPREDSSKTKDEEKEEEIEPSTFRQRFWDWAVNIMAAFIAAVLSHPAVQVAASRLVVLGMNAFLEQEDIGDRMDTTARSVLYDHEKRKQTAREVGKDALPLVADFMGGVLSSVVTRRKKEKSSASSSKSSSSSSLVKTKET